MNKRQATGTGLDAEKSVVWSFFTGAMGLDLGLEEEGFRSSLAVEIEEKFCNTIRENRPGLEVIQKDVADIDGVELMKQFNTDEVDLMIGGPPCQSFSTGGNRTALSDPRGNAIFEYLRLVSEIRPKYFVLENVANLVTAAIKHRPINQRPGKSWNLSAYSSGQASIPGIGDEFPPLSADELSGSAIRYLIDTVLEELGYSIRFQIIDSADYGAPQKRLRFVMIGGRDEIPPPFIAPTHGEGGLPFVTVRDAIGDLENNPGPGAKYTEVTKGYFDLVPEGGNWRSLPYDVAKEAMGEKSLNAGGGKTGFFRRLHWDRQSPTITGKPNRKGSAMCHPSESRPLSVNECARLQGFPDGWKFYGSVADRYLQIGNAVPVALGKAIGKTLHNAGSGHSMASTQEMLDMSVQVLKDSARNRRKAK